LSVARTENRLCFTSPERCVIMLIRSGVKTKGDVDVCHCHYNYNYLRQRRRR